MENFNKLPISFDIDKLQQATNELFSRMSWRQHIVKGLCLTQIPGDPSSADGDKLRGVFYTKPDSTGKEVKRENNVDESQYTEFVEDFKGTGFFILECANPEDYVIPEDADGNPIKLLLSPIGIAVEQTAAATAGQTKEFAACAKEFLGEEDIYFTGAQKAEYEVEQGKSKPEEE